MSEAGGRACLLGRTRLRPWVSPSGTGADQLAATLGVDVPVRLSECARYGGQTVRQRPTGLGRCGRLGGVVRSRHAP